MPQIPVYDSQVSAGGVPQTPRATADDFGAQTSKAVVGLTQAGLEFASKVVEARHAAETNRGEVEATQKLKAAVEDADKDDDFAAAPERFKQSFDRLRAEYAELGDSAFRSGALRVLDEYGPALGRRVSTTAAKREIALHRRNLGDDVDFYIGQAAAASNDLERQININLIKTGVARAYEAGYIDKKHTLELMSGVQGRIEEKQAEALIQKDAKAAVNALEDPKQYRHLEPTLRELLIEKAKLADQHAHFATVSAVQQGIADGTKSHDDVDALFKDGLIGRATRALLDERVKQAAKERAQKVKGRQRVQSALDEGGKLDPKKATDRAAGDAYFDAVVAPAKPDQAILVAFTRRIGMVPDTLGKQLRGGLASDDPQQVANTASLLRELGKHDDALVKGFGTQRLKFANAVMDGIDGGLSPKRAVELADKSHGQPNASDAGTEKAKDTPRGEVRWVGDEGGHYGVFVDGVERTGADTEAKAKALLADIPAREMQRPARPGKGESGKDDRASAGAESGTDAETGAADEHRD